MVQWHDITSHSVVTVERPRQRKGDHGHPPFDPFITIPAPNQPRDNILLVGSSGPSPQQHRSAADLAGGCLPIARRLDNSLTLLEGVPGAKHSYLRQSVSM
jgi:hypothetical protein